MTAEQQERLTWPCPNCPTTVRGVDTDALLDGIGAHKRQPHFIGDPLRPARGIINGLLISLGILGLVAFVWFLFSLVLVF